MANVAVGLQEVAANIDITKGKSLRGLKEAVEEFATTGEYGAKTSSGIEAYVAELTETKDEGRRAELIKGAAAAGVAVGDIPRYDEFNKGMTGQQIADRLHVRFEDIQKDLAASGITRGKGGNFSVEAYRKIAAKTAFSGLAEYAGSTQKTNVGEQTKQQAEERAALTSGDIKSLTSAITQLNAILPTLKPETAGDKAGGQTNPVNSIFGWQPFGK